MAKVTGNPSLIKGLSGAIGNLMYRTRADGQIFVQPKPTPQPGNRSTAQLTHEGLFKAAVAYGNKIKADPFLAPLYELVCTDEMRAYHAGLRDFLVSPTVEGVEVSQFTGKPGGLIRVAAWDDFQVIQLLVVVRHATTQEILEQGPAEWAPLQRKWVYTCQAEIPSGTSVTVEATATDRPGNQGSARVLHLVP